MFHDTNFHYSRMNLVFKEFSEIADDAEDANWRKFLGEGSKTKIRSLHDLLDKVSAHCDAQTNVDEFNIVLKDKKMLHALHAVLASWIKTGGGHAAR